MRNLKLALGVIGALVPILYCGGLIYYFVDMSGSVEDAQTIGLGPTLLGLTIVGLLFCAALVVKVLRIFMEARAPGSDGRGGSGASTPDGDFDPDAVLARYMAQRSAEGASGAPAAPPAQDGGGPAARSGFGRRVR